MTRLALLALPLALAACSDAYDDPLATSTSVFQMPVGMCMTDRRDSQTGEVGEVAAIPCERPHRQEVFHVEKVDFPSWPGQEAVDKRADEICDANFEAYVGLPYDDSEFLWSYLSPNEGGWNQQNDREVVCVLVLDGDVEWTGSAKGTKR